jgi:ubiquinone/menaquinone biosynthesis C-methylase UbiE
VIVDKVRVAKYLMNARPRTPTYQEAKFVSEVFKHPRYTSLSEPEKAAFVERLVRLNIQEHSRKPLDLFFPSHSLEAALAGKRVLDLGCGIGGLIFALGERWKVREFYGLDVNQRSIDTANLYVQRHKAHANCRFVHGYAENMPFEDDCFDAIVSHDTLEHVRSLHDTLSECRRVLRDGGVAFLVFPSFNFPFGGAHIDHVTGTPFLEWFFSPSTLNHAYQEIAAGWDEDLDWYRSAEDTEGGWAIVKGGIGVNGTGYAEFVSGAAQAGFSRLEFVKIPLLKVSETAIRHPVVKGLSALISPLMVGDKLKDYLSHRLVFVLHA